MVKWRHLEVKGGSGALVWGRTSRVKADCSLSFFLVWVYCLDAFVPHNATEWVGAPPRGWKKKDKQSAQKKGKPNAYRAEYETIHGEPVSSSYSFFPLKFFFSLLSNIFSWSIITFNKLNKQIKTTRVSLLSPTFYWSLSLCCVC